MSSKQYLGKRRKETLVSARNGSPESRLLADTLTPLDGDLAGSVLLQSLDSLPSHPKSRLFRSNIQSSVDKLRKRGWDKGFKTIHEELGMAADRAFRVSFEAKPGEASSVSASLSASRNHQSDLAIPETTGAPFSEKLPSRLGLVTDSEDGRQSGTVQGREEEQDELLKLSIWSQLLEAVQLQVSARGYASQSFVVYQLAGPIMSTNNFSQVRNRISRSFLSLYNGSSSRRSHGECRVHIVELDGLVWVQINLSRPGESVADLDARKPGSSFECLAVLVPDSPLIALSPSRRASQLTRVVLSSLEHSLTCSVVSQENDVHQFQDLAGTNPQELLKTARSIEARHAVGRLRKHASEGEQVDPVKELQSAATSSLLCNKSERSRITKGRDCGRHVGRRATGIAVQTEGRAAAVGEAETGCLLEHNTERDNDRKRTREASLGLIGDCPIRKNVRWEFNGRTNASSRCWPAEDGQGSASEFKCRVVMKGSDVYGGIHELVQNGYMKNIPRHVQEAPALGDTISVDHGIVQSGADPNVPGAKNKHD